MTRRELLAGGAACATTLWARSHMDKLRISAITDEIGLSTDESIAFAHQYGLHFVEIRNPPGNKKEYFTLTEAGNQGGRSAVRQRGPQGLLRQHQPAEVRLAGQRAGPPPPGGARRARKTPGGGKGPLGQAAWKTCKRPSAARRSWDATRSASSPARASRTPRPCTRASPRPSAAKWPPWPRRKRSTCSSKTRARRTSARPRSWRIS